MIKRKRRTRFTLTEYIVFTLLLIVAFFLSVCVGSVGISLEDTINSIVCYVTGAESGNTMVDAIILSVRIPRAICVGLSGAALAICGAAMQGLLKNPLADGSTLGVTAGASLGAVTAIAFGTFLPFLGNGSVMISSIVFAFASLVLILTMAYGLDRSLSTNTIILIGVIFSMFANSLISLAVTFAGDKVKSIMFWTMGSLAGTGYAEALYLFVALVVCGGVILSRWRELDAFAIGEDNARNIGVDVKSTKLIILITVSVLIGVCVSIGGTIGFVGLVIPHMVRMVSGPEHARLLPGCMFAGAIFLMLMDLLSRLLLNPIELPIGVVTSFIGSFVFIYIFYSSRKVR